ncbi:MAG: DUF4332 domain-containing protein [Bradymonadales bacterium]|jgi:nucleotidyltransferase/DNA polymerase involved in DNA repair
MLKKGAIISFACAVILGLALPVQASHYELQDIELVGAELREKLLAHEIDNTEQLLAALLSGKDRAAFAKAYGLGGDEVMELAQKLELMQLPGIGPKAATLLLLAEIGGVRDLAAADAQGLLERLLTANRVHAVTGVQPDNELVKDWIKRAKAAIHLLQP